jgi:hypothetical protein
VGPTAHERRALDRLRAQSPEMEEGMNFHPDVLAAHAQFGGDLESMQKLYEYPDLIAAARQMVSDYQTSEHHHPNHVLVPLAAFEAMRAALKSEGRNG